MNDHFRRNELSKFKLIYESFLYSFLPLNTSTHSSTHMQQDIMTEVIVERGIMLGRSKWRHSSAHGQKLFSSVTN